METESDHIEQAALVAMYALYGQVDENGLPYIFHPITVASAAGFTCSQRILALLHDVVERTEISLEDLRDGIRIEWKGKKIWYGLPDCMISTLDRLIRRPNEAQIDHLKRIAKDRDAVIIKLEELEHIYDIKSINLSKQLSDGETRRFAEYQRIARILTSLSIEMGQSDEQYLLGIHDDD